jgi:hypothetical protein
MLSLCHPQQCHPSPTHSPVAARGAPGVSCLSRAVPPGPDRSQRPSSRLPPQVRDNSRMVLPARVPRVGWVGWEEWREVG